MEQAGKRKIAKGKEEIAGLDLRHGNWELVDSDEEHAVFRRPLPELKLEIVKTYRLAQAQPADDADAPAYHLEFDLVIRNTSSEAQTVAYRLDGPNGLPLEGAWYATKTGLRDVVARVDSNSKTVEVTCPSIADDKTTEHWSETDLNGLLDFVAVDAQYFAAALLPTRPQPELWFEDVRPVRVGPVPADKADKKLTNVSFRMTSLPFDIEPKQELKHTYRLFAGPKKPDILTKYTNGRANLSELISYGWFGWVARPMSGLLHTLYALVGNYGLAIVMLTVLVRGAMMPLSRKQAASAAKMQEMAPRTETHHREVQEARRPRQGAARTVQKVQPQPLGRLLADVHPAADLHRAVSVVVRGRRVAASAAVQ